MHCSVRLRPAPIDAIAAGTTSLEGARRLALYAAVIGGGLLMLPLTAFSDRNAAAGSVGSSTCAALDIAAADAIARRIRRIEAPRPDIARSAQIWLAEARRHCTGGDPERAEQLYERIIAVNDLPG